MVFSAPEPHIPDFDNFVISALDWMGVNGAIILLVATAFVINSWWGPARGLLSAARHAVEGARQAAISVGAITPARRVVAAVVTGLVAAGQAGALLVCYLNGNLISLIAHDTIERSDSSFIPLRNAVLNADMHAAFGTLATDVFSVAYVAAGLAAIFVSYRQAREMPLLDWRTMPRLGGPELVMALPEVFATLLGGIFLLFTAPFVALAVLIDGKEAISDFWNKTSFFGIAGAVALCGLVWFACRIAISGSYLVMRIWRPSPPRSM